MGTTVGSRERALFCQTLAPLIKGLEGTVITAELKNDRILRGTLVSVDCFLNLTMEDVTLFDGREEARHFDFFFLHGKKCLRYVRIPDEVDIKATLENQLAIVSGKRAKDERRKGVKKRANWLKKKASAGAPEGS